MNNVIDTILAHRSIRAFKDTEVSSEQLERIIQAGIAALHQV